MKRLLKPIFCASIIAVVFFTAIFAADKLFSKELYMIKDSFSNIFGGELPKSAIHSENGYDSVNIAELLEKGAILDDSLMLINSEYPLSDDYQPALIDLSGNEVFLNPAAAKAYNEIKNAVKNKYGSSLYIMSSYRTPEEQAAAIESEGDYAAGINESEHLTGLALDVYIKYHAGMGFLDCDEGRFVNSYCQDYGFIIRYPYYGESITGIPYEPWHLRYVGFPHAKIIAENRITLEEYIESLVPGTYYYYEDYFILRQSKNEAFSVPEGIYDIIISPDNTGFYIITGKTN
ncbi:MAG: M15 family metallopeptidase [Oscillospiraceae bacterium]|nr:M15 family metallopeptidase [Oscillospiraceae bacterium]